jgi:Calcium-binding EGF domain
VTEDNLVSEARYKCCMELFTELYDDTIDEIDDDNDDDDDDVVDDYFDSLDDGKKMESDEKFTKFLNNFNEISNDHDHDGDDDGRSKNDKISSFEDKNDVSEFNDDDDDSRSNDNDITHEIDDSRSNSNDDSRSNDSDITHEIDDSNSNSNDDSRSTENKNDSKFNDSRSNDETRPIIDDSRSTENKNDETRPIIDDSRSKINNDSRSKINNDSRSKINDDSRSNINDDSTETSPSTFATTPTLSLIVSNDNDNDNESLTTVPSTMKPYLESRWNDAMTEEPCGDDQYCEHSCIITGGRLTCRCNDGFVLQADGKSCREVSPAQEVRVWKICRRGFYLNRIGECEDIDECRVRNNACGEDAKCENRVGSYACVMRDVCRPGFTLNQELMQCEGRLAGRDEFFDDFNDDPCRY